MERTKKKIYIIGTLVLFLFAGSLVGWNMVMSRLLKDLFTHKKTPLVTISTITVSARDWQPYIDLVGTLFAARSVSVRTEVAGVVQKIGFESGALVKKGQLLVQLDDRLEQHSLKGAQAARDIAAMVYRRHRALRVSTSIAQAQLDQDKAHLAQAQAVLDRVRVEQQHKQITVPFDGRVGLKKVSVGEYITPGSALVDIYDTAPLEIHFVVPERWVHHVRLHQHVRILLSETEAVLAAEVSAIDAALSSTTHTLSVVARLLQKHPRMHAGMFAHVQLLLPPQKNTIIVPQTAVIITPYGDSVYVVIQKTAHHRFVQLGVREGNSVVVRKGLRVGEQVVTAGQLKLREGAPVLVNNGVHLQ